MMTLNFHSVKHDRFFARADQQSLAISLKIAADDDGYEGVTLFFPLSTTLERVQAIADAINAAVRVKVEEAA